MKNKTKMAGWGGKTVIRDDDGETLKDVLLHRLKRNYYGDHKFVITGLMVKVR